MKQLQNHIWLIGASEGIGRALALELAKRGATLTLSARNEERLDELQQELLGNGHRVAPCDVAEQASLDAAFAQCSDAADTVIFNVGMYNAVSWEDYEVEKDLQTLDINVNGAFRSIATIRKAIDEGKIKRLVLVGSVAGYRGLPKALAYGASKAALNHFAEGLRIILEEKDVVVQLVCPGFVKTRLTAKNNFPMPMCISAQQAATAIANGMETNRFEIHFPKRFTYIMKLLHLLPHWLYFTLARHT